MPQRHRYTYLMLVIGFLILPSAVALLWYHFSRDPNLRPLGITEQALRAYNGKGEGLEIVAIVDWAPGGGRAARDQFATTLRRAFRAKGADVRVEFRDGQGTPRVTFSVGKTVLGPYTVAAASEGIAAAVQAFNMH